MKINRLTLDKLDQLLDNGILTKEEYNKKVIQLLGYHDNNQIQVSNTTDNTSNIIWWIIGIIVALIIGLAIGVGWSNSGIVGNCESAVADFYLDNAVVVYDDGSNIYHRYGCPDSPSYYQNEGEYSFWIYNSEAAESEGYSKCPTCFIYSIDEYIDKYIY